MKDIIKLTTVLVVISVIAALLLALTYDRTRGAITEQQTRTQAAALEQVLPHGADIIRQQGTDGQPTTYWVGILDEDTVAYAFEVRNRGYSSEIAAMVGIKPDGEIVGVAILSQAETPGLGTRIQEVVSRRYIWHGFGPKAQDKPWFTEQFEGINVFRPIAVDRTAGEWHGLDDEARRDLERRNAVTAITGATISTQAVSGALEGQAARYLRAISGERQ